MCHQVNDDNLIIAKSSKQNSMGGPIYTFPIKAITCHRVNLNQLIIPPAMKLGGILESPCLSVCPSVDARAVR